MFSGTFRFFEPRLLLNCVILVFVDFVFCNLGIVSAYCICRDADKHFSYFIMFQLFQFCHTVLLLCLSKLIG